MEMFLIIIGMIFGFIIPIVFIMMLPSPNEIKLKKKLKIEDKKMKSININDDLNEELLKLDKNIEYHSHNNTNKNSIYEVLVNIRKNLKSLLYIVKDNESKKQMFFIQYKDILNKVNNLTEEEYWKNLGIYSFKKSKDTINHKSIIDVCSKINDGLLDRIKDEKDFSVKISDHNLDFRMLENFANLEKSSRADTYKGE